MIKKVPTKLFFICAFVLSVIPGTTSAQDIFTDKNGVISMEAEHAHEIKGWIPVTGMSGGKAMQDTSSRGQGRMSYNLKISEPGPYFVFLLCRTPGGTSTNDCFIRINGDKLHAVASPAMRPDGMRVHSETYAWTYLPKGPGAHTPNLIRDKPVFVWIKNAGTHQLEIISRSKLFCIDKIILKRDDATTPHGSGHPETMHEKIEMGAK